MSNDRSPFRRTFVCRPTDEKQKKNSRRGTQDEGEGRQTYSGPEVPTPPKRKGSTGGKRAGSGRTDGSGSVNPSKSFSEDKTVRQRTQRGDFSGFEGHVDFRNGNLSKKERT